MKVSEEGLSYKRFTFNEACESFNVKEALIPSKTSETEIECNGKVFSISKFCEEKFKENMNYTRARFDLSLTNINCHFASTVIMKIECSDEHKSLCNKADESCKIIKKNFAYNLEFIKSSVFESLPMQLSCFYSKPFKDLKL